MDVPIELTFRHIGKSDALEAQVREHARKLERFYDHIISCRVVVEAPHKQHNKGNIYHVRVDVTVPEGELVASRDPAANHAHEDAYVAIRDAFNAMVKQLDTYAEKRRREVKQHYEPPRGTIAEINVDTDSGRIDTTDGRSIYFHRNAVKESSYEDLLVGQPVSFEIENGGEGPQALVVRREG